MAGSTGTCRGRLADGVLVHTGSLDLNVPPFVKMDYDTEARRLVLSIEDREVKQQKEMWGASTTDSLSSRHNALRRTTADMDAGLVLQERHGPTFNATSLAYPKAIPPSSDSLVLDTVPRSTSAPSSKSTLTRTLSAYVWAFRTPSTWGCQRESRHRRHSRLVFCWRGSTGRS